MTLCRLHFLSDCTDKACAEETETLTGSAVPFYDGTTEALIAASAAWCSPAEERAIWTGTGTE
jgi:hypothetical protein